MSSYESINADLIAAEAEFIEAKILFLAALAIQVGLAVLHYLPLDMAPVICASNCFAVPFTLYGGLNFFDKSIKLNRLNQETANISS